MRGMRVARPTSSTMSTSLGDRPPLTAASTFAEDHQRCEATVLCINPMCVQAYICMYV